MTLVGAESCSINLYTVMLDDICFPSDDTWYPVGGARGMKVCWLCIRGVQNRDVGQKTNSSEKIVSILGICSTSGIKNNFKGINDYQGGGQRKNWGINDLN